MILTIAWLHDVNDHKYNNVFEMTENMKNFLSEYYNNKDVELIMNIIDRISFSKENKIINSNYDWFDVIGQYGIIIRDIVSDADKIEALGNIGFQRCLQFTR